MKVNPGQFVREVRQEVSKVVPPTRSETLVTTVMVLIFTAIMATFFFAVDWVIGAGLELFLGLV